MPVSPGASGMQPRGPCRPWRGTLASGHKPRFYRHSPGLRRDLRRPRRVTARTAPRLVSRLNSPCILLLFILYFLMPDKVKTTSELKPLLGILRAAGKKIVFTNGCFDLIHTGHTRYLASARALGDLLIVAVNSDSSVRTIKGEKRPINAQSDRAETLAALESVDFVTIFDEPDPYRVISELLPDVLVKGGDWPVEKIIGRDVVEARGGRVVTIPFVDGASTTGIIEKIVKKYGAEKEGKKVKK